MEIAAVGVGHGDVEGDLHSELEEQSWPREIYGFYTLFVVIFTTFVTFLDQTAFGLLAEKMKLSFGISDFALGMLLGPVTVVAYVVIGIPIARLVDKFQRKYVLAAGITGLGAIMTLGGLAQSVWQLIGTRLFLGASSSVNAPGSYSILVDYFRPLRIPLVFALLQLGFIAGSSLGNILGGRLIRWTAAFGPTVDFLGLQIFSWQLVMVIVGVPGMVAGFLWLSVREPRRRGPQARTIEDRRSRESWRTLLGADAARAVWQRKRVFLPLFVALAMSALESQGLPLFRVPLILRTYEGWDEARIGDVLGLTLLCSMLLGILVGGVFVTWLGKRYKDANIRATFIFFACATAVNIAMPLMPTGELAILMMALSAFFGLAAAPAQNAAIQRIVPNEMRGQVTALYIFMFTFFGALGPAVIGSVSTFIVGNEQHIWKAILITGSIFLPLATFLMWRAIGPYREEVERLEKAA
jgi:MFS family permease